MPIEPSVPSTQAVDDCSKRPFLRRVRIRGYKSIAFCDVYLEPLTILVGPNAAGKSNFLEALAFLRDAVRFDLSVALEQHGGLRSILCRSATTDAITIAIEAEFPGPSGSDYLADYRLSIPVTARRIAGFHQEKLRLTNGSGNRVGGFELSEGKLQWYGPDSSLGEAGGATEFAGPLPFSLFVAPGGTATINLEAVPVPSGHLVLSMIGTQPYIDVGDALRWMGFYNFHPEAMRSPQKPNPGWLMEKDGHNIASVIETTRECEEEVIERVSRYLSAITQSVTLQGVSKVSEYETVRFRVSRNGQGPALDFDASSMSDGTLRALAALVAAFQIVLPHGHASVVGIEEPESSLHPAAMRALVDALDEATARTQILLTTHSTELLDNPTIRAENIRVVKMIDGRTVIAAVDEASADIVRRELNTLGGLERDSLLEPNLDDLDRQTQLGQALEESPA